MLHFSFSQKLFCRIQESSQVLYKQEQSRSKHEPENELTKQHPSVSLQQYKVGDLFLAIRIFKKHRTIVNKQ